MKKMIFIIMIIFLLFQGAFAIDLDASLSFGYTTLPGTVTIARGTAFQKSYAPFDAGWVCHSAAGLEVFDNFYAGLSSVFVKANPKKWYNSEYNSNLINIMAGAWYKCFIAETSFAVTGKIFAGISFADLSQEDLVPPNDKFIMSGTGFSGDVLLEASYTFDKNFSVIVAAGYRKAFIPEFKYSRDINAFYKKGDVYIDDIGDGKPIAYDFSGLILSAGIGLYY